MQRNTLHYTMWHTVRYRVLSLCGMVQCTILHCTVLDPRGEADPLSNDDVRVGGKGDQGVHLFFSF